MSFDLQPHLKGDLIELRPLRAGDWDGLYAAASDPLIWAVHPAHDRYKEAVFREYFKERLESRGCLVAIDRKSGAIIGSSSYFWAGDDAQKELEIGWTFLARAYWGGAYNGEMKRVMLQHAFSAVDHVIFMVGAENVRSQAALKKIGATLTPRRLSRDLNGRIVEHVVYEIRRPE